MKNCRPEPRFVARAFVALTTVTTVTRKTVAIAIISLTCCLAMSAARAATPPAALFTDPVDDAAHPATGQGIQFRSHGALLNAMLYRPSGVGPHPTALVLHGLPGNEQNLDLAQVLRRAGWTVITFHYTGSWGSGGRFTLHGGAEDAAALVEYLHVPAHATAWDVDPEHMIVVGHSYGGFVAARTAAEAPGLIGVVLLAPWDPSVDYRAWVPLTPAGRATAGAALFDDVDGRLAGATHGSLTTEIMRSGGSLDLAKLAAPLASRPVLVITAKRDSDDDQAAAFVTAMQSRGATHLTTQQMDTDHGFNSHRIALEVAVLRWVATLPGAPQ